jgi:hypothetical protein
MLSAAESEANAGLSGKSLEKSVAVEFTGAVRSDSSASEETAKRQNTKRIKGRQLRGMNASRSIGVGSQLSFLYANTLKIHPFYFRSSAFGVVAGRSSINRPRFSNYRLALVFSGQGKGIRRTADPFPVVSMLSGNYWWQGGSPFLKM